jgi:hypothetical protein
MRRGLRFDGTTWRRQQPEQAQGTTTMTAQQLDGAPSTNHEVALAAATDEAVPPTAGALGLANGSLLRCNRIV